MTKINFDRLQKLDHPLYDGDIVTVLGLIRDTEGNEIVVYEYDDGYIDTDRKSDWVDWSSE